MRTCQTEVVMYIFVLCKRQVWEKSEARERGDSRFLKKYNISENLEKLKKIDVHSAKSSISRQRDYGFRGACP